MIDAPYPSDLEAKGWSLDLDYERIEQSDTWAIASPEQRPWLLMLWMISWRQVPVASLPNNDRLIAARIGMPVEQFTEWKEVLLSGWELATDGRLYHKTLTAHVLRMAEKRNKDRARVAAFRAKSAKHQTGNGDVTRYTGATNAEDTGDSPVSSAPTPTPTDKPTHTIAPDDSFIGAVRQWKPVDTILSAKLAIAGIPPPDPSQIPRLLDEFHAHYASKAFTDAQCYTKFVNWIRNDRHGKPTQGVRPVKPSGFEIGDAIGEEWLRKEREREAGAISGFD
ncbi:MAG: DnaT-like ssDNA-binding domain-containing protein [Lysobacterales bacterium]